MRANLDDEQEGRGLKMETQIIIVSDSATKLRLKAFKIGLNFKMDKTEVESVQLGKLRYC